MPSMLRAPWGLLLWGGLLPAVAGCGPSPAPVPPPAPTVASVSPPPPAPPPKKEEAADVDYGAPPNARCVPRDNISPPRAPRSTAERNAARYALARKILEAGRLLVELDARKAGVVVPPRYQVKRLVLAIGHNLPQPIPDLAVDAEGFSGQLLFKMKRFPVRVPWSAVYGLMASDDSLSRWLEDVPADVLCPEEEDEPVDVEIDEQR